MYIYPVMTDGLDEFYAVIKVKPYEKERAFRLVKEIKTLLYINSPVSDDGDEISFPVMGWEEYIEVKKTYFQMIGRVK